VTAVDTTGEFRGYDAEGHKVVVGWVQRDGSEYLIAISKCCGASGKGSESGSQGIVCRRCSRDVSHVVLPREEVYELIRRLATALVGDDG
jgi:hypothetical protein